MTYESALSWLFAQLPMYQNVGKIAFKKDLTNTIALAKVLGNPEQKIKTIHVGGTNGKGSTSHMIASVLQEAGYKVGLYTSPHLKNFTERIRINGKEMPEADVVNFVTSYKDFLEQQRLSFFEMTFGMALDYFAKQAVDVAVIEVGLGGRLDSTNIIKPELSVITNIGLDHVAILGDTLPKIAYEKAGIIKQNTPVVIGEKQEEVIAVFTDKAKEETAPLVIASDATTNPKTDLLGIYQKKNAKTAYVALQELAKQQHFKILESDIKRGLTNVTKNTGLKGRWQVLQNKPFVVADTAHNKEGLTLVLAQLQTYTYNSLHIVLGLVSDKNTDDILQLFPKDATYYFCKPNVPRGLSETVLQDEAKKNGLKGKKYKSVIEAYKTALSHVNQNDIIYVGGSTFVVAEII